jgi:hypothetical protein
MSDYRMLQREAEDRAAAHMAERAKLQAEIDALRQALRKYGRHLSRGEGGCEHLEGGPCTCGLDALLPDQAPDVTPAV